MEKSSYREEIRHEYGPGRVIIIFHCSFTAGQTVLRCKTGCVEPPGAVLTGFPRSFKVNEPHLACGFLYDDVAGREVGKDDIVLVQDLNRGKKPSGYG